MSDLYEKLNDMKNGLYIFKMRYGHPLWNDTEAFAENCSWGAGKALAAMMRENRFSKNERVFTARDGDEIVGFCTLTMKDELPEDSPYSPFVGFVFVEEHARGRRISEKLIDKAAEWARYKGFDTLYITSGETGLYEKYGFENIGSCKTIYGTTEQLFARKL